MADSMRFSVIIRMNPVSVHSDSFRYKQKPKMTVLRSIAPVWIPRTDKEKDVKSMTDVQKAQIFSLRMQGAGYRTIAKGIHLTEDQVKLYCKSHGLGGDGSFARLNHDIWCREQNRCLLCGAKLRQPVRGRRKVFCGGRCRTRYCRIKNQMEVSNGTRNSQLDSSLFSVHMQCGMGAPDSDAQSAAMQKLSELPLSRWLPDAAEGKIT